MRHAHRMRLQPQLLWQHLLRGIGMLSVPHASHAAFVYLHAFQMSLSTHLVSLIKMQACGIVHLETSHARQGRLQPLRMLLLQVHRLVIHTFSRKASKPCAWKAKVLELQTAVSLSCMLQRIASLACRRLGTTSSAL